MSPAHAAAKRGRAWRSLLVGGAIVAAHAAIALLLTQRTVHIRVDPETVQPMIVRIIEPQAVSLLSLNPDLAPAEPAMALKMPTLPAEFEATDPAMQPPTIDPEMRLDVSTYSARALLPSGAVVTVILLLEIGPDGSVMSAKLVRRAAEDAANEVALEYARNTHWLPGRVDGQPKTMQASLTVILGERA
jgi:Gram-negative bacterial TonB protein C-terminal